METSGIRIGATNLAILGYSEEDILRLGNWIGDVVCNDKDDASLIQELTAKYNEQFVKNEYQ